MKHAVVLLRYDLIDDVAICSRIMERQFQISGRNFSPRDTLDDPSQRWRDKLWHMLTLRSKTYRLPMPLRLMGPGKTFNNQRFEKSNTLAHHP